MTREARLALVAVVSAAGGVSAFAQALPDKQFFVKNNSDARLSCTARAEGGQWLSWFPLKPGAEWKVRAAGPAASHFFCRAPAAETVYRLVPGERYSLLRSAPGQAVTLRRIAADPS